MPGYLTAPRTDRARFQINLAGQLYSRGPGHRLELASNEFLVTYQAVPVTGSIIMLSECGRRTARCSARTWPLHLTMPAAQAAQRTTR